MSSPADQRLSITDPDDPRLHRRLRALWRFWLDLRGSRRAPRADEVTPFELRPWLGSIALVEAIPGDDFRYRLYGSVIAEAFGFDLTGRTASECIPLIGPLPLEEYRRVVASGQPEAIARSSPARRDWLRMDKLSLPLAATDGGPLTRILVAIYTSEPVEA